MATEVYETKNGALVIECECGRIHKIKPKDGTDELEIKTTISKNDEVKKDSDGKTQEKPKRTGFFGRDGK